MTYRSRSARLGAAMAARLFAIPPQEPPMRRSPDDPQSCIRAALRRRRRALGLTQAGAAQLLGLHRIAYHRIEAGTRRIAFEELGAICDAFGCHIGELIQDGQLTRAYTHAASALLGREMS